MNSIYLKIRIRPTVLALKLTHKNQNWKGKIRCPICKGVIHVAHNGDDNNIWLQCETTNCVSWIE